MMPIVYCKISNQIFGCKLNGTADYSAFRLKKACGFAQEFVIVLQASSLRSIVISASDLLAALIIQRIYRENVVQANMSFWVQLFRHC